MPFAWRLFREEKRNCQCGWIDIHNGEGRKYGELGRGHSMQVVVGHGKVFVFAANNNLLINYI